MKISSGMVVVAVLSGTTWLIECTAGADKVPLAVTVARAPDKHPNGERPWPELPEKETAKIVSALPDQSSVKPKKPQKLLVFYRTDGYPHSSIPHWNKLIELLGKKTGAYEATLSQSYADLLPERLAEFDAVFFNNTCRMNTPPEVKSSIQQFVKEGKGFAGNHGAGDNWHDWAEGMEMLGAEFVNHPFGSIQIKIDDPQSPLTAMFSGKPFPFQDEIYAFKTPYSREKIRPLLSIDYPNSPDVAQAEVRLKEKAAAADARQVDKEWAVAARPDHDYAISWIRPWGKGRVFYCSLGHRAEVTFEPTIIQFFLAGIQYALGDLKADDRPLGTSVSHAEAKPQPNAPVKTLPAELPEIFSQVRFADGLEASPFAAPPLMNSPVFLSAAPDGTLYLTSDPNGSAQRDRGRGRVLRLRDTDDDGQADEVSEFVSAIDAPRGLVAHGSTVFVLHPPHLSAYIDHNADGVADEQNILVKNIGWSYEKRAADHGSNGLELGIDGWIYAAIGDFGFMNAEGTDGRKLQLRGGGIVRVRTDGSGLEVFSYNTRNVLEAAISPLLDGFARDNTNDGGGWNTRFHHFTGLEDHGYPRLYKNFADEIVAPIADYGGGSGCGAVWMGEPGWPSVWSNRPIEADWGKQFVAGHSLRPQGGTFIETETPHELAILRPEVTRFNAFRPTDLDVDARGRLYLASWRDGGFGASPKCGFVFRLQPVGFKPAKLPDFAAASSSELASLLLSPSHRIRMEAQRLLLQRGLEDETAQALEKLAADRNVALESRVAAVFTLRQGRGERSFETLEKLSGDVTIGAWAVRAMTDDVQHNNRVSDDVLRTALKSNDPRTRREALVGAARLGKVQLTSAMTTLLEDADPVIAHTAVRGLTLLSASEACFGVIDDPSSSARRRTAAARVLHSLHQEPVVTGLAKRIEQETEVEKRRVLLSALCRLFNVEGEWQGDSWGTVPDRRGPYFQPELWRESDRIGHELAVNVDRLDVGEAAWLAAELTKNRVASKTVIARLVARAERDTPLAEPLMGQLANLDEVPAAAVPLMIRVAIDKDSSHDARAYAIQGLSKVDRPEAFEAVLTAFALPNGGDHFHRARTAYRESPYLSSQYQVLVDVAASDPRRSHGAYDGLMMLLAEFGVSAEARAAAAEAIDHGWNQGPEIRRRIIASARDTHQAALAKRIAPLANDPDPQLAKLVEHYFQVVNLNPRDVLVEKPPGKILGNMPIAQVLDDVQSRKGNRTHGERLFNQLSCAACHSTKPEQTLKGPFLGNSANIYKRRELAIAVLEPAKTIAQGFATNAFVLHHGRIVTGFVVREAAHSVTIRNANGQELTLLKSDIEERHKQDGVSMMPNGLVAKITVDDFASLLTFLESLATNHL